MAHEIGAGCGERDEDLNHGEDLGPAGEEDKGSPLLTPRIPALGDLAVLDVDLCYWHRGVEKLVPSSSVRNEQEKIAFNLVLDLRALPESLRKQ